MLSNATEALALLRTLGAHPWLVRHHELVLEAGEMLLAVPGLTGIDRRRVRLGCALHDVGKISHPGEMSGPGHEHEEAGRALLLEHGVAPEVADMCVTHARWEGAAVEDRLVALADHLWKGKRSVPLEEAVIAAVAAASGRDFWAVYPALDEVFERVAAGAGDRMARSRV
jgi:HD superfamily phosphodiesterase